MVDRHDDAVTVNDEPCAKHETVDICLGIRLDEVSCESSPPAVGEAREVCLHLL